MLSSFSFLGEMLDKTRLKLEDNSRHQEIYKAYLKSLGAIGLSFILTIVIILCGLWVFYKATNPVPAKFYIPQEDKLVPLPSSPRPLMSTDRVKNWVSQSLMDTYTMNFINYNEVLSESRWIFRDQTYDAFVAQMMRKDGLVDTIRSSSLSIWLTPTSSVRIINSGRDGNNRVWMMEMSGLLSYTGALQEKDKPRNVTFYLIVEQTDTTQNPYGLQIAQISVR